MMFTAYVTYPKKKKKMTKQEKATLIEYNSWRKQNGLESTDSLVAKKFTREFKEYRPKIASPRSNSHVKSLEATTPITCARTSIMDRMSLDKEPEHVREQILAKSKRIAQMYNKGGYQYITDDVDVTTIGTRSRRM